MSEYWIRFLSVIIAVAVGDMCWTVYFIKIEERHAIGAATWATILMLVGAYSASNYIQDKTYIVAACIGAFIGTYTTVWWKNKKEKK